MAKSIVSEIFGSKVFNEMVMRERLPKDIYKALKQTIDKGTRLQDDVAQVVANAMKDWAVENGATHYTHWFHPMTGVSAEKHEAFISSTGDGKVIMEFSGKALIKGESDASSFPSGGLRATFEARGYTAWDPTSYAFVKDNTLYIPTAFCSYSGEALDKKIPLLRSIEALSIQAVRVLNALGGKVTRVISTVGPEQEYFLVDKGLYDRRSDLKFAGRTLFGAPAPKGQEMDDHYYGTIKERVGCFMKELDEELWKLGIFAKTKHNEVAPAQHELALVYNNCNLATDHNQLTMEMMQRIALRHNLVCLLHEKPFSCVNGSGKHNNWSLSTNDGENLLKPGKNPCENKQFLLFLSAIIKAVDERSGLIRASVATSSNDLRLGANEAPPAIISIFLGQELTDILEQYGEFHTQSKEKAHLEAGVAAIPVLYIDNNDRNRTSPFAFTGDKFEFRMVGSSQSISNCNIVINTAVAEVLREFADRLESAKDVDVELLAIIKDTYKKHHRIIFNGNNYTQEWAEEAHKRGLPNLATTVDALPNYVEPKSIELFEKHNVLTEGETRARYQIMLEDYIKTTNIEAKTMLEMSHQQILPACIRYSKKVCDALSSMDAVGFGANVGKIRATGNNLCNLTNEFAEKTDALSEVLAAVNKKGDPLETAKYFKNTVLPSMVALRKTADMLETIVSHKYWPIPTYTSLLFDI